MRQFFFAFLLLAPAAVLADECGEKTVPAALPAAWLTCAGDADCATLASYCDWRTANKMHKEDMNVYLTKKYCLDRIEYECPQSFKGAPQPVAKCINQQCVIPKVTR
jgi:hypothetical protein